MRLVVAGGGTGGHIYPALAVVEALLADDVFRMGKEDILWLGSVEGMEREIVSRERLAFKPLQAAPMLGRGPVGRLWGLLRTGIGSLQAWRAMRGFRPDVVLATGGYVSAPAVVGARMGGYPCLIYLPDMHPGVAVRRLAGMVQKVAISFAEVAALFPEGETVLTGYPVRRALYTQDGVEARERLGLSLDRPVLLVMGGSQGAHSINQAVQQDLVVLLERAQIVHVVGSYDYQEIQEAKAALPDALSSAYHPYEYLHEGMVDALAAADLVVARAGAATLAEFPAAGLPAILVPYPYSGQHQWHNAEYLARRDAAVIVKDDQIADRLPNLVTDLLADENRLQEMAAASRKLARPDAAGRIARELLQLVDGGANG